MCSAAPKDEFLIRDNSEGRHLPVLLGPVIGCFASQAEGWLIDATFGGGGHTRALLEANPWRKVLGLDRDPRAAARASVLAGAFPGRFAFVAANFADLASLDLRRILGDEPVTGILADFGVSSFQLDDPARGFSFREDAPVDMRMDDQSGTSAADFLETASREDLVRAIRDYGEEPRWRAVCTAIEAARGTGALGRTRSLADILAGAVGHRPRSRAKGSTIHPATRSFQGIRIAVNDELGAIEAFLPAAFERLAPGGIFAVISFHSLEDRLAKRAFNRFCGRPEHGRDATPQDARTALAERLMNKPVTPDAAEIAANPRSRSARLRAIRKLSTDPGPQGTVTPSRP